MPASSFDNSRTHEVLEAALARTAGDKDYPFEVKASAAVIFQIDLSRLIPLIGREAVLDYQEHFMKCLTLFCPELLTTRRKDFKRIMSTLRQDLQDTKNA